MKGKLPFSAKNLWIENSSGYPAKKSAMTYRDNFQSQNQSGPFRTWGGSAQYGSDNYRAENYHQAPNRGFRGRSRSMNFEEYASDGNRFINLVADELGCDRNTAARVTKAVLHAIRDRLPANDAVEFAQGLPMAIKGVYFDQYDISSTPVVIRHTRDFLNFVCSKDRIAAIHDFPDDQSVIEAIRAVFNVLENTMDPGQVEQVKNMLHHEVTKLLIN